MHRFTSVNRAPPAGSGEAAGAGGPAASAPPLAPAMPAPLAGSGEAAAVRVLPGDSEASFRLAADAGAPPAAFLSPIPPAQRKYPIFARTSAATMLFNRVTSHLHSSADSPRRTRAVADGPPLPATTRRPDPPPARSLRRTRPPRIRARPAPRAHLASATPREKP